MPGERLGTREALNRFLWAALDMGHASSEVADITKLMEAAKGMRDRAPLREDAELRTLVWEHITRDLAEHGSHDEMSCLLDAVEGYLFGPSPTTGKTETGGER